MESFIVSTNNFQESEVGDMQWFDFNICISKMRPYNLEKKNILKMLNNVLREYRLY